MKKSKGQTIDLLYTNKKETNKKSKKAKTSKKTIANDVGASIARPKKNRKTNSKVNHENNNIIDLNKEMIIGLTPKKEEKNTKTKKASNKKIKANNKKNVRNATRRTKNNNKNTLNKKKKQNLKKKRKNRVIKWILIFILLAVAIAIFMMSSVFNIKEIVVINNEKVSSEEIISLSNLNIGVNMFKITNGTIKNGIKTNAYIEDIVIKRNINGTITLDIKERTTTYMLKFANAYVYINNQGYMLEISESALEIPVITGFTTTNEEIKAGNRLNTEDLQKLDDVIKIIETSKNTPLANIITEIDISDSADYKLTVASENKKIRTGEMTNINIKLQMASKVFEAESGKAGEIYFQDDGKKAIFKEDVVR